MEGCGGETRNREALQRPSHKWEGNIKLNFKELLWEFRDKISMVDVGNIWWHL